MEPHMAMGPRFANVQTKLLSADSVKVFLMSLSHKLRDDLFLHRGKSEADFRALL